jgi:photosystem II stability/assembly factor-like uncharacterized protein
MSKLAPRSWFKSLFSRRTATIRRPSLRARLALETFESRDVPSSTLPLNGTTWTAIGPSPISNGQSPGGPTSTGRLNGIAVDPSDPNVMYVAADTGGIWRTTDGGATWSARTDQQVTQMQVIAMVNRGTNDTVYAFDQNGNFYRSTDGATTFTNVTAAAVDPTTQIPAGNGLFGLGSVVNKLVVYVPDANDQTKDILFAAVGSNLFLPPSFFPGQITGSGIWRSDDGGDTWTNIVNSTASPFNTPADSLSFTDIVFNPTNPNVAYAAIGNSSGDPTNGVYKTINALSDNPTWTLLIGGSSFLPGSTPGNIKLAMSPQFPSEIFASISLRSDPVNGSTPLLGVFRTTDAGVNWTPVLVANPANQNSDPLNYMGGSGSDNNVILVSPFSTVSPSNALTQTIYVAGAGNNNTVLVSNDSGTTWTPIGIGSNGVGTYPSDHQGVIDSQGRLVLATGGGVYRLNSVAPVTWVSLNGNIGPNGLSTVQFNGFALSPTDPDRAVGNIGFNGDTANGGLVLHNALLFADSVGKGAAVFGWQTVDATGFDGQVGSGQVIYNPFNPNIVYRVTNGSAGESDFIRRSDDGGLTWTAAASGFQGYPFIGGSYVPPLAIDPSVPNRLFSGYNAVQATDTNGVSWRTSIQVSTGGATVAIPPLPTTLVDNTHGGVIGMTAIGVGRESGVSAGGFFGLNGVTLFVGTEDDSTRDANGVPQDQRAGTGPQLYVNLIPTNQFPFPGGNLTFGNRSWANITPTDSSGNSLLLGNITQVLVDPTNNTTLYLFTDAGQVIRGTNFTFTFNVVSGVLVGVGSANWTELTGNLPVGVIPGTVMQDLALDPRIATQPNDDVLYAGTAQGVWKLTNPGADFSVNPPVWQLVGVNPADGSLSMPPVPVTALSLNTSTGILGAATYGRGVYELQVRGIISGTVFNDTNGNGIKDTGEAGVSGLIVQVLDLDAGGSAVAVTTTDANGVYQFRSLRDGDYRVVVSAPSGQIQTTAQPADFLGFTEQSTFGQANFGFFTPGSISGVKYQDSNANGVKDGTEPGLAGFTIYIDANNNGTLDAGEVSTVTGATGTYSFTNLGPPVIMGVANSATFNGTYPIREVQKLGFQATNPVEGAAITLTLSSGQAITNVNFGNRPVGSNPTGAPPTLITANDAGGAPLVTVRNPVTGVISLQFNAYAANFTGGVRVATGFFNNDSKPDIITAPGPGGGPDIRIFDGATGGLIGEFYAYAPNFTGGVYVAIGDVNHDGRADIITGADAGGGPDVRVFSGLDGSLIRDFYAYGANFTGGVRVASADIDRDGYADIITGAGPGGGPHVQVFSGRTGQVLRSFYAYAPNIPAGVFIAAADVNGDGFADIITGPGSGGPNLRVFSGTPSGGLLADMYAFPPVSGTFGQFSSSNFWTSGLRVGTTDINGDGKADIIVSPGRGQPPLVRIIDGASFSVVLGSLTVGDPAFLGGIFVAGI